MGFVVWWGCEELRGQKTWATGEIAGIPGEPFRKWRYAEGEMLGKFVETVPSLQVGE